MRQNAAAPRRFSVAVPSSICMHATFCSAAIETGSKGLRARQSAAYFAVCAVACLRQDSLWHVSGTVTRLTRLWLYNKRQHVERPNASLLTRLTYDHRDKKKPRRVLLRWATRRWLPCEAARSILGGCPLFTPDEEIPTKIPKMVAKYEIPFRITTYASL